MLITMMGRIWKLRLQPTYSSQLTNGDPLVSGNFAKWQNSSKVQVDLIDNNFKMPRVWRSSLALDYTLAGYKLTLEGIYTKVIYDLNSSR
jgi:hypothetical protein